MSLVILFLTSVIATASGLQQLETHNTSASTYKLCLNTSSRARETYHEHAAAYAQGKFRGFKTTINIWKPHVEKPEEFTLSQLWLISSYNAQGVPVNTIEAGWQIYPRLYGDNQPRLFVYWTADGYNSTGCYNLACDGFVQVNHKFVLGEPIYPTASLQGSDQVEAEFLVFQDRRTGNWWLRVAGSYVGYWPASTLPDFANGANEVSCGGEIFYTKAKGQRHTRTQMGSGNFPYARYKYAAYHRDIRVVDEKFYFQRAKLMRKKVKQPGCYDLSPPQVAVNKTWGTHFFFGGPGYNSRCLE